MITRFFLLLTMSLLTLIPCSAAEAEGSSELRLKLIREVQALRSDKGSVGFDEHTGELAEILEKGDAGLAYQVAKSGDRMLDNEAYFAVLASAILYHRDSVTTAFEELPAKTRNSILDVCAGGGELAFEDADKRKKFEGIVADLKKFSAKLPETPEKQKSTRPAYIDDPDGYTNLRLGPTTKDAIIDEIKSGEEFQVIREQGDWCLVESPRKDIGWVHKSRVHYKYAQ